MVPISYTDIETHGAQVKRSALDSRPVPHQLATTISSDDIVILVKPEVVC